MLTRLKLKNFKSWEDTGNIELKPITGFFGANSSGKTSLFQALLLLKQTAASKDRGLPLQFGDNLSLINLGDFQSVIYRHNTDSELLLEIDWKAEKPFSVKGPHKNDPVAVQDTSLGFSTWVSGKNGNSSKGARIWVEKMRFLVGKAAFGLRQRQKLGREYELFAEETDFKFKRTQGRVWPLPPPSKCYGFPDQVRAYYQNAGFLSDLELAFEEQLNRTYYLGPLRANPERTYTWAGSQPADMGQAGELAVHALLSSRDRGEMISRGKRRPKVTLEQYVAEWLTHLGLIAQFRVEPVSEGSQIFQVKVKKEAHGPEALITDVGFGVSQILPVIVLCFYVPQGSTVVLEQPEIHLHPAVQAGLADVLIDAWKKRNIQILVESHSEHLLRRLQRRIAEEVVTSENDVALFFCKAGDVGSELVSLNLDLFGRIENWPDEFFGDAFGEVAATQDAILRRQRQDKE